MKSYAQFAPTGFDHAGAFLPDRQDWLVAPISLNRDSDIRTTSNWEQQIEALGGEGDDVEIHRFGHWACGWFEVALVRPDSKAAEAAKELENALADYPILNDEDCGRREYEAYNEAWESWGAHEFVRELTNELALTEEEYSALSDRTDLQEFFEKLNKCGDYQEDGAPVIGRSVRNASIEDVTQFLKA